MCAVSMIMEHYGDKWQRRYDQWPQPYEPYQPYSPFMPPQESEKDRQKRLKEFIDWLDLKPVQPVVPRITEEEIKEFRELLDRAREYDKRNQEPECELDEKKQLVKDLAKKLGVEIDFL